LIAAIGPGIGVCCYEVGAEVAQQFGLEQAGRVDLASANRVQLIESAVPERHIEVLGLCTFCDPGRFHSYRRDKQSAGRMVSYIRTV
jgi:copper oxidase (laccase) domain-containing protein